MSVPRQSVTSVYAQAIVQAATRRGIELPPRLTRRIEGAGRVPLHTQDELWELYCRATTDPLAGLRLGLDIEVGHLDSAGLLLVICDTLGEALALLVEYAPIIGEGGDFTLHRTGGKAAVDYRPHLDVRRPERVEAALAVLLKLARWATGDRFRPHGLRLAHTPLDAAERYRELLGCPVRFASSGNGLDFDAAQLSLPLIQANAALREHLRRVADDTLVELGQNSVSAAVQRLVRTHPHWGKERVAASLHLSGRHLNRKLTEEGQTFKTLRQGVLHDMARQALKDDQRSLGDIADALGFSDENAFSRAFRRWQGETPARYRLSHQGTDRN